MPQAPRATGVLAPALLWQAAYSRDGGQLLAAWLHAATLTPAPRPTLRW
jgi:hypothetical protein